VEGSISLVKDVSEGWYCAGATGFKFIPSLNEAGKQIYLQAFVLRADVEAPRNRFPLGRLGLLKSGLKPAWRLGRPSRSAKFCIAIESG